MTLFITQHNVISSDSSINCMVMCPGSPTVGLLHYISS